MATFNSWNGFNKNSASDKARLAGMNSGSFARQNPNLNMTPPKTFSPTSASARDALQRAARRQAGK